MNIREIDIKHSQEMREAKNLISELKESLEALENKAESLEKDLKESISSSKRKDVDVEKFSRRVEELQIKVGISTSYSRSFVNNMYCSIAKLSC
jgi:t-SNARE complex subunit (syntaxin)